MFFQGRIATMKTIGVLGFSSCGYFWPGGLLAAEGAPRETEDESIARWVGPTHRCDCKYSYVGESQGLKGGLSESTGCPELRSVYKVLAVMEDEEWDSLVRRTKDGVQTSKLFNQDEPTFENMQATLRDIRTLANGALA
jgi:hypothetical protein